MDSLLVAKSGKKRPELVAFGGRVKARRLQCGMTQVALATAASIHAVTVSRLEAGLYAPDITVLAAIAKALDTTSGQLMGEESAT